ncbi:hypothetical protein HYC85_017543 [Camellia sinensis]|uniref:Poly(A) polymerase nucleotidyltransferase domain-containing protein n=1 Tax=Camellia sinensis TaxID=4442 RepID=A0A7J7GVD0_CAMSI|nr:hypothetical protein HYC85_017543 [Camellia sinensis]
MVHNLDSDIDALCVGPCFATLAVSLFIFLFAYIIYDIVRIFFVVLHNMLTSKSEVSEVHCVKDAKVPLMRVKLDGISIDLPYAQLKNVDILNPFFLRNIDETSWRSLFGVHVLSLTVVPAISIVVRQFGRFLRELPHSTQSAAAVAASIAEVCWHIAKV